MIESIHQDYDFEPFRNKGMLELKGVESDRRRQIVMLRISALFFALCFLSLPIGYDMLEEGLPLAIVLTLLSAGSMLSISFLFANESRKGSMPMFMDKERLFYVRCQMFRRCVFVGIETSDIQKAGFFRDASHDMRAKDDKECLRFMVWVNDMTVDLGVREKSDLVRALDVLDTLGIRTDNRGELADTSVSHQ